MGYLVELAENFWANKHIRIEGQTQGALILTQIKVAVKQAFDPVDSIIFEAALTLHAIETRNRQKEYAR